MTACWMVMAGRDDRIATIYIGEKIKIPMERTRPIRR